MTSPGLQDALQAAQPGVPLQPFMRPCDHANKTTAGMVHATRAPRTETYVRECDALDHLPDGVEAARVRASEPPHA